MSSKVGLISLGCPKNLVDSEYMLGRLVKEGYPVTYVLEEADTIIVNTCAFIESAQQEAIDTILEIIEKSVHSATGVSSSGVSGGGDKKFIVAGCLVSLFGEELLDKIPQINALIDPFNIDRIVDAVKELQRGRDYILYLGERSSIDKSFFERCITHSPHSVYLKIADGCNNCCSYCIIPKLRGPYRSRRMEDIIEETELLAQAGCKEINIVAQDTTLYGTDIYGEEKLSELLDRLAQIKEIRWIRVLYTHPAHYTDKLIETVAANEKICKYLDLPLQHSNDRILQLMGRNVRKKDIMNLINKLRRKIPNLTLRTTLLVGFPTEGTEEFCELLDFVKAVEFDHLGVFSYSLQENTRSINLKGHLPERIKEKRRRELLSLQKSILEKKNRRFRGEEVTVLIDKKIGSNLYEARTKADAPEVDNVVYARGNAEVGGFYKVKITKTGAFEFEGNIIEKW
ncbi:MAG TPA: 30S ribosomal protein S12 methylthiotransferase RimO [Candidatus Omnitrophica bacterium]|nr:30S ribosomal protein S12 methylthiotransferase RimO [Candidatus Omnitrophota bacterium]